MTLQTVWLFIRSIIGYLIIGILGIVCLIPLLIIACLPSRWRYDNRLYYWINTFYYKAVVFATFLPITIEGKNNIPYEPAIFVANHQSALDIPLLGSLMNGHPHVWMFLKRYAHYPVFGFIARRMNIVVDTSGLRKLVGSIHEALDLIKDKKRHVLIFPEGGRYTDNTIHHFFAGFAMLATDTGRPVVPVAMLNVNKAYPPYSFLVHPYPIKIVIGKPFFIQKDESEEQFIKRVHAWFVEQMEKNKTHS